MSQNQVQPAVAAPKKADAVQVVSRPKLSSEGLEAVLVGGNLRNLRPAERVIYYMTRCEAAGLDAKAHPFQYIVTDGKLVLYATRGCTDQISARDKISFEILERRVDEGMLTVRVKATTKDQRFTEDIGCVWVGGLSEANLCNAHMKAVTKAKRRSVLSLSGLGMPSEDELETMDYRPAAVDLSTGELKGGDAPQEARVVQAEDVTPEKQTAASLQETAVKRKLAKIQAEDIDPKVMLKGMQTFYKKDSIGALTLNEAQEFLNTIVGGNLEAAIEDAQGPIRE